MFGLNSISERLLFSVVRVVAHTDAGAFASTGSFFRARSYGDRCFLVSCRHAVDGARRLTITGHAVDRSSDDLVPAGRSSVVEVKDPHWIAHPDEKIDLTVLALSSAGDVWSDLLIAPLEDELVPTDEQLRGLSAMEDVVVCGCPEGLWDDKHGLPILRRGMTATHPCVDHRGTPTGVLDVACFEGSTGSPALIINDGMYLTKDGALSPGGRAILLGITFEAPHYVTGVSGTDSFTGADLRQIASVNVSMHLAHYVKSREILAAIAHAMT